MRFVVLRIKMVLLSELAEVAWHHPATGKAFTIKGHAAFKDGKMVVLTKPLSASKRAGVLFYAFPKTEHADSFAEATSGVLARSHLKEGRGAVGSASLYRFDDAFVLDFIQSHFIAEQTPEVGKKLSPTKKQPPKPDLLRDGKEVFLSRSLATKYGGWRVRCLKQAILYAHSKGCDFHVFPDLLEGVKPERVIEDLKTACRELNLPVSKEGEKLCVYNPEKKAVAAGAG